MASPKARGEEDLATPALLLPLQLCFSSTTRFSDSPSLEPTGGRRDLWPEGRSTRLGTGRRRAGGRRGGDGRAAGGGSLAADLWARRRIPPPLHIHYPSASPKGRWREIRRPRPGPAEGDSPKVPTGILRSHVRVRASDRAGGPCPAAHRDQDVLPVPE